LPISIENYRIIVDKALAGLMVYRNERIVFVNARVTDLLGYTKDQVLGRVIWDFIHPEDREDVRAMVGRSGPPRAADLNYECRLLGIGDRSIWVEITSSPVEFEGEASVFVHLYDITERKAAESKRQELIEKSKKQEEQLIHSARLAELGEMAASIAHEINQPLTGIRNYAKNALYMMVNDAGSRAELMENLQLITEQVDRASRIITQMRMLTSKAEQQFQLAPINPLVREVLDFLAPQFKLAGVEVRLDLAKDLPAVRCDRIRLEQVLLNLLTNARQAMEVSPRRVLEVRSYYKEGHPCPITVDIVDTGKGFSPEEAKKLFAPFFSTKKPGQGTGLGLSISLNILKEHKGVIEGVGEVGRGATFTIRLPVPEEPRG
jgi:PAS domain S-box-containing protein